MQDSPVVADRPCVETPPEQVIPALPVLESSESDSVISTTPYALQDTATQAGDSKETEIALQELVEKKTKEGFGDASFDTPKPSPKRKATGSPENDDNDSSNNNPSNEPTPKLPSFPIGKRAQEKRRRHISPSFRKRLNFSPVIQVQRRLDFLAVAEAEVEEFFGHVEANHPNVVAFIERFNFDVINDVPLPGRYEWVQVSD